MNPSRQKKAAVSNEGIPNLYLNMEHLLTMAHGERQVLQILIEKSIVTLEESRLSMEQAMKNNPVAFRRELHKLKGSLGIIEPTYLYNLCRDLEKNYMTLNEEDRSIQSNTLVQGITLLLQELRGVSTNDN